MALLHALRLHATPAATRALPLAIALALSVAACGDPPTPTAADPPPSDAPVTTTIGTDSPDLTDAATQPSLCPADPGTAPSGELTATRIAGSGPGDELPRLYEGPVWIDGALYYSDFVLRDRFASRIQRFTPPDRFETVIADSGSNGLAVDADGHLVAATHDRKQLSRYELPGGARDQIVGLYDGQPFNSPNDLVLGRAGTIYFTDPAYQRDAAPGGQEATRVYRFHDGGVSVVEDGIENPNGIALSPSGDTLYVNGGGDEGVLRAYPVDADGVPGAGRDLAQVSVPDGMAVDCLGNLYVTEHSHQRVRVFSPQGDELATIAVDANITNAAFGGPDARTLYLTGAGALWSIDLQVSGLPY